MKIIHFSDIHIGYKDKEYSNRYSVADDRFSVIIDNLQVKLQELKKREENDYVIIVTGDLVNQAGDIDDDGAYQNYKIIKDKFTKLNNNGFKNILIIPGNHDYYKPYLYADQTLVQVFQDNFWGFTQEPALTENYPRLNIINNVAFIGLDSMSAESGPFKSWGAEGDLGQIQRDRLVDLLNNNVAVKSCAYRVIYLHHNPFERVYWHILQDSEEFKNLLKSYNDTHSDQKIDLLLFGHTHNAQKYDGNCGVSRCYEAGSTTRKEGRPGIHRLIDIENSNKDIDLDLHGNYF